MKLVRNPPHKRLCTSVAYACFALAGKLYLADYAALLWACLGMGWGMVSFLLMGIDSLISRFF